MLFAFHKSNYRNRENIQYELTSIVLKDDDREDIWEVSNNWWGGLAKKCLTKMKMFNCKKRLRKTWITNSINQTWCHMMTIWMYHANYYFIEIIPCVSISEIIVLFNEQKWLHTNYFQNELKYLLCWGEVKGENKPPKKLRLMAAQPKLRR